MARCVFCQVSIKFELKLTSFDANVATVGLVKVFSSSSSLSWSIVAFHSIYNEKAECLAPYFGFDPYR